MLRFAFLGSRALSAPRGAAALAALAAALLVSSCLTPSIEFGEDPADRSGGTTGTGGAPGPGTGAATGSGGDQSVGGWGGDGQPPVPHCINGTQDSDETDRDCGGDDCPKCGLDKDCKVDSDCKNDSCVMATCQDPECTDKVKNGDEADVDCGAPESGCGACDDGDSCVKAAGCLSGVCKSGECAEPACNDKVKNAEESDIDCGGSMCNRCDAGSSCDVDDDCAQPPDPESFATCEAKVCTLTCGNPLFGDCNTKTSDSCETNLLTAIAHCGACGETCSPDNAVGQCVAGNCLIDTTAPGTEEGCLGTYANCNGETDDGCEADLSSDAETCSSCDVACSATNGTPDCDAGVCNIDCASGFDDCNDDTSDGCEVDLTVSTLHCTQCFNACSAVPPAVPVCDGTQCIGITCNGVGDCGGVQPCGACDPDTQCNDLLTTTTNCGGCGISCIAANAVTVCEDTGSYACAIESCSGTYLDCDQEYLNGCEIETDTNKNRCGDCLSSDPAGGSGEDCDATKGPQVAQTDCSAGACTVLACNSGYADCNGTWSDGCEVNLNTSNLHCGGCTAGPTTTWDGGASCSNLPHATGSCSTGTCNNVCDSGWFDTDVNMSNGCESRALARVGNSPVVSATLTGSGLSTSYTLAGSAGSYRTLLVGVICKGNTQADCTMTTATYGTKNLTLLGSIGLIESWASIYYMNEATLATATNSTLLLDSASAWGSVSVQVVEYTGVEQTLPFAVHGGGTQSNGCSAGGDAVVTLSNTLSGSQVFAISGGFGMAGTSAAALPLTNLTASVFDAPNEVLFGSAVASGQSGTLTGLTIGLTGCYRSAMYAAALRRETD